MRRVAETLQHHPGARHVARKGEKIQVILNACRAIDTEARLMREALEQHELNPCGGESVGGLSVRHAQAAAPLGILDVASLNLLREP